MTYWVDRNGDGDGGAGAGPGAAERSVSVFASIDRTFLRFLLPCFSASVTGIRLTLELSLGSMHKFSRFFNDIHVWQISVLASSAFSSFPEVIRRLF